MSGGIFTLALECLCIGGLEILAARRLHADGGGDLVVLVVAVAVGTGGAFAVLDGGGGSHGVCRWWLG